MDVCISVFIAMMCSIWYADRIFTNVNFCRVAAFAFALHSHRRDYVMRRKSCPEFCALVFPGQEVSMLCMQ